MQDRGSGDLHATRTRGSAGARRGARAFALAAALAACAACGGPAPRDPWPEGAAFAGRRAALDALLGPLRALGGTPLAREAARLADALPDCPVVGAHAPDGDVAALAPRLRCLEEGDPLLAWRRALGREGRAPDLLFALPRADGARLRGTGTVTAGGDVDLEIVWSGVEAEGPLALLLPGDEAAGPDVLASAGRALHLRVRPHDGLDVAALVPAGSQADRLFHLKSGLFASAVLDGTWEAAVYVPEAAGALPRVALALGFRARGPAVAAAERFLADFGTRWSVRPAALRTPAGDGACLPELNVLPALAPCYVATDRALVVGWNPASLRTALAPADAGAAGGGRAAPEPARLDVDLSLVEHSDALLARPLPADERPPVADWPWRHLRVRGERRADGVWLRVALEAAAS